MAVEKDDDVRADEAFEELRKLFSKVQPGKSRYSGIHYNLEIRDGEVVFVPDAKDLAIRKAFEDALREGFGPSDPSDD